MASSGSRARPSPSSSPAIRTEPRTARRPSAWSTSARGGNRLRRQRPGPHRHPDGLRAPPRRIRRGTAVLVLTLRNAAVLARQVSTLHHLSGGRLALGVSLGGRPEEYLALDVPMKRRVAVFRESVTVLRRLLARQPVDHQGQFFHLENATGRRGRSPRGSASTWRRASPSSCWACRRWTSRTSGGWPKRWRRWCEAPRLAMPTRC